MLLENPKGGYSFIAGGPAFSAGCVAGAGFEIVHAAFRPAMPLEAGFARIERFLAGIGRPREALCGVHLRIPAPLTPAQFEEFNRPYVAGMKEWGLVIDGRIPVARTNVAPDAVRVANPSLAGFYFAASADGPGATFVLSGAAEVAPGPSGKPEIVARGDTSPSAIARKLDAVLAALSGHLEKIGAGWANATAVNLYTVHDIHPLMPSLLSRFNAGVDGITWHYARPPVIGLEVEIDVHAVRRSIIIDGR